MIRGLTQSIGATGAWLLLLLLMLAIGSLGTVLVAPLFVIPLVGLIAVPFMVFPTLLLYAAGITAVYLVVIFAIRAVRSVPVGIQVAALIFAILATCTAGVLTAKSWNSAAGVDDASLAKASNWAPLKLERGGTLALVRKYWSDANIECETVCLSLLVTGRAKTVIVANPSRWPIQPGDSATARHYSLVADWRACLGSLDDYGMMIRQAPGRRDMFREFGFDPYFQKNVQRCLQISDHQLDLRAQPALIVWEHGERDEAEPSGKVGFESVTTEQSIVTGAAQRTRMIGKGRRYVVPAVLSPYAGNAGFGGYFQLSWALEWFETADIPRVPWWSMLADGDALANDAMALLDQLVPATRRQVPERDRGPAPPYVPPAPPHS